MGKMIIVVAPSGAGKSTFIDEILKDRGLEIKDIITYTTRSMREGESEGEPYHFLAKDDFKAKIEEGYFVEWAQVHSSYYGTAYKTIRDFWQKGYPVILDVDIQGAETLKSKFPEALVVFVKPPSFEALKERLLIRGKGELPPDFDVRMESARREMDWSLNADEIIVNDDFDKAFSDFRKKVEIYIKS